MLELQNEIENRKYRINQNMKKVESIVIDIINKKKDKKMGLREANSTFARVIEDYEFIKRNNSSDITDGKRR